MLEGSGTGNLMNTEVMDWIHDVNLEEFDSCEDVAVRIERITGNTCENDPNYDAKGNPLKCPVCEFVGKDYQRARAHFKTHDTDILVKTILTNQCPVCDKTFTDTMCARQQGQSLQKSKMCPAQHRTGSNKFGPTGVKQIDEHTCGICNEEISGYDNVKTHCKQHILDYVGVLAQAGSSRQEQAAKKRTDKQKAKEEKQNNHETTHLQLR